jgi:hypothetical protein
MRTPRGRHASFGSGTAAARPLEHLIDPGVDLFSAFWDGGILRAYAKTENSADYQPILKFGPTVLITSALTSRSTSTALVGHQGFGP